MFSAISLLSLLVKGMYRANFGWNWWNGSGEGDLSILLFSPLGIGHGPSFEETWIPFTQECFVPSLNEIDQEVLEKKKCKVYDNGDAGKQTKFDKKSLFEPSA